MHTGKAGETPRIKLAIRIDRPPNLKHCGYLFAQGKQAWKKWKMRFFALVQEMFIYLNSKRNIYYFVDFGEKQSNVTLMEKTIGGILTSSYISSPFVSENIDFKSVLMRMNINSVSIYICNVQLSRTKIGTT